MQPILKNAKNVVKTRVPLVAVNNTLFSPDHLTSWSFLMAKTFALALMDCGYKFFGVLSKSETA